MWLLNAQKENYVLVSFLIYGVQKSKGNSIRKLSNKTPFFILDYLLIIFLSFSV